jgi:hypothetical protein
MNKAGLLILFMFLCTLADAQHPVRISLFYEEPQLPVGTINKEIDSIFLYVKEPFQQVRMYAVPDFGYETGFDISVGEYCPAQICKNNTCFDLFLDSEKVQVLIDPGQFSRSKPLDSPLSELWRSALSEERQRMDLQMDSLVLLFEQQPDMVQISAFYEYYNEKSDLLARKWIMENSGNLIGWNLLLRNFQHFDKTEISDLINQFGTLLSAPSVNKLLNRLAEYNKQSDPAKSIYGIFDF